MASASTDKVCVALAIGDPAGISPELAAKLAALQELRERARLIVIGDRRVLDRGAADAGLRLDVDIVGADDAWPNHNRPLLVDLKNLDPAEVRRGVAAVEGGRFALANYSHALRLAKAGRAQAVCFTPFNKHAMRLARAGYDDEIAVTAEVIGSTAAASEFNVLGEVWNARVTSHVPLSAVASLITTERVLRALRLTDETMKAAGFPRPRIAVAGLNPHAGDGGNFGHEEIDVIAPAVKEAKAAGIAAEGPFSPDTVFLRAKSGACDAVLTMYHDQGQIAMKLMGFERGVTLLGGFPFPVCTPAHGTAYDIAGQGTANVSASRAAVQLAIALAEGAGRN
jgi:4-hydroxythreonine-4-phosphate dehydrogenase